MADDRLDIAELYAAVQRQGGKAGGLAEFLRRLSVAVDRVSLEDDSITWLTDRNLVKCAIVPGEWARAIQQLRRDPGSEIAKMLGSAGQQAQVHEMPHARPPGRRRALPR